MNVAIDQATKFTNTIEPPAAQDQSFLIVDDHPLVRDSLHDLLQDLCPSSRTSLAICTDSMRQMLASPTHFDYAIVDLSLPNSKSLEVLRIVREMRIDLPIIVYSARTEQEIILRCLNFGVLGYIPKTYYGDRVSQALRMIFSGHTYIPQQAVTDNQQHRYRSNPAARRLTSDPRDLGMTERQIDVLHLMLRGMPNKVICRQLDLAEGTVKVHVSNVLRALGVRNRTQAVIAASEMGIGETQSGRR
ncbi:MAG: response regulator transcription factor [Burkholderiaceae bacterium]